MIDTDGIEWLPVAEAARVVRVRVETIYVWINRRKVRAHKHRGRAVVRMPDVYEAEHAWRASGRTRGSRTQILDKVTPS